MCPKIKRFSKFISTISTRYFTSSKTITFHEFIVTLLVGALLTTAISIAIAKSLDTDVIIYIIIICLFAISLFFASLLIYKIIQKQNEYIDNLSAPDVIIHKRSKIVTFSSKDVENNICTITDSVTLENKTKENYGKYLLTISSSTGDFSPMFTGIDNIVNKDSTIFEIDGVVSEKFVCAREHVCNNEFCGKSTHSKCMSQPSKTKNILNIELTLDVPPDKISHFSFERKSDTMKKVFIDQTNSNEENAKESVGVTILHKTKKLKIACYLSDNEIRKKYVIASHHNGYGKFDFDIYDGAKQPLKNYKIDLSNKEIIPEKRRNGVVWNIPNPMVGCTYKLYFFLLNQT